MRRIVLIALSAVLAGPAIAAPCTGHPNALGVSRVLPIDPKEFPQVGNADYGRTLPLAPGEVVLTFDDGPIPPATNHVLEALANECVQATFFLVGRNARLHPDMVRRIEAAGHTIGTHTQNHPLRPMSPERARYEIDTGIASVGAALGSTRDVAPFFRFPGLFHTRATENYLHARGISSWSIDVESDDWRRISAHEVLHRIFRRLDARGRGIVLMHDIHAKTAGLVPTVLRELKARGYRVVHVVAAGGRQPAPAGMVASAPPAPSAPLPQAAAVAEQPPQAAAANAAAEPPPQAPIATAPARPAPDAVTPAALTPVPGPAATASTKLVVMPPPSTEIVYAGKSFVILERPRREPGRRGTHQPPIERIYMPRKDFRLYR